MHGVTTIVQLGDFGYTFDSNLLASIGAWLMRDESHKWYWLDGNHDQHDYIENVIMKDRDGTIPIAHFHDRMYYCPRGSIVDIGDKVCMFMGGAYSIDKNMRHAGTEWWPQEMIRESDLERAFMNVTDESIDVVFSHDTPPTEFIEEELYRSGYKSDRNSAHNRQMLGALVNVVRPRDLYHGHYHWRYDTEYIGPDGWLTRVHGIGANVSVRSTGQWLDPTARPGHNYIIQEW